MHLGSVTIPTHSTTYSGLSVTFKVYHLHYLLLLIMIIVVKAPLEHQMVLK